MMSWTIEAALESGRFHKVVVSTEDDEIARIASDCEADVQIRPADLARDDARVVDVCRHVLDTERTAGTTYTTLCCLYPTAPLRGVVDIQAVVDLIEPPECNFAMATTDYSHPPHQALRATVDGLLAPMWPELVDHRADELPALVVDNGSTYAASVQAFLRERSFYGPQLRGHYMPRARSVDIDTHEDLAFAVYYAGQLES